MKYTRRPLHAASHLLALALSTSALHAAVFTWNGAVDSNWNTTTANWTGSAWGNATGDQAIFDTSGVGPVNVTTPVNANLITFSTAGYTVTGGTITLSGTTPGIVATADATISSVLAGSTAAGSVALNKTGAGTLTLSGLNTYTGITQVNAGVVNLSGGYNGGGAFSVAATASSRGVLNVTSGTYAFSTGSVGTGSSSAGTVNQSGGTLGFSAASSYFMVGNGSYGSYTLSGGNLNITGSSGIRVGYGSAGVITQTAGALASSRWIAVGGNNSSGVGVLNLLGGTSSLLSSSYYMLIGDATGAVGTVNIGTEAGGTATFTETHPTGISVGNASGATGRLNLNSGTLVLSGPLNKAAASTTGILNLNGGTLQPGVTNTTLIAAGMTATTVYNGGLNVNTNGLNAVIAASLTPATGNGIYISGGTLPIATGGGAGYMGAPVVTVSGGTGTGAMAIANVSGGVVTGVTLTNPGQGYTAGDNITFAFASGGFTTAATSYVYTLLPGDLAANTSGGMTKTGNGTLTLTAANTYTGTTTLSTGTLQIGNGGTTGSLTGPIVNNANLTINRSDDLTYSYNVSGNGSITKAGTNKLTLDYSVADSSKLPDGGTLVLGGGTLNLTGGSHVEVVSGTTIAGTVSVTRTSGTATLALGTITLTSGQLDIAGTGIATTTSPNVNGILPGVTILGQQAANDGNGNIIAFSNFTDINRQGGTIITGSGQNIRIVDGGLSGTITLAAGTTDINSLSVTATGGLSTVAIGTGSILRLAASGSVKTLTGTGGLTFTGGSLTAGGATDTAGLIVFENTSSNPITIASDLTNNGSGAVAISKIGDGTLILSGTNNYSGATAVTGGTLKITTSTGLGTTAAGTTIASGAALELEGNLTIGAETLSLGGTGVSGNGVLRNISGTSTLGGVVTFTSSTIQLQADAGSLAISQPLAGVAGVTLTKTGAGNISLLGGGATTLPTTLTVNAGKLTIGGGSFGNDKMSGNGVLTINSGATVELISAHALGGDNGTMNESIVVNGGTLTFSREQYVNTITLNGATVNGANEMRTVGSGTATVTGSTPSSFSAGLNLVNNGAFNVADVTASSAVDLTMSGVIYNTGNLTKTGAGTLLLTGTNTYSGTTTLTSGTIQLGNGGATGKLGTGNVINNATLVINRDTTADLVIPGVISGGGSFTQIGGKTVLGGNNTYTAITTISGGSVQIGNGGATGSFGTNSVTNNGAVIFNRDATTDLTVANAISGSGSVTQNGIGKTILSGANTYSGNTTVNSGTLSLSSASLADSSTVEIAASGASLELNHNGVDVVDKLIIGGNVMSAGTWGGFDTNAEHQDGRLTGLGVLSVTTGPAFDAWAASKPGLTAAGAAKADNPDNDDMSNFGEFAFDGEPLSGKANTKIVTKIATIGSDKVLTLTLPVRNFSLPLAFTGSTSKSVTVDGVIYTVEGSEGLGNFDQVVTEVTGTDATAIQTGLPGLSNGWTYHTFRATGIISPATPKSFLRARVSDQ